jgi:hypothetical protein
VTTFIEDSPRPNLVAWMKGAIDRGQASAVVLDPWLSPLNHRTGNVKPGLAVRIQDLSAQQIPFWLDPMTHVLDMPGARDLAYYSQYDLWAGNRGDLTAPTLRREHVRRVVQLQRSIGARTLAPTTLLPTGLNNLSTIALDLARLTLEEDPTAFLSVAGVGTFWADGPDLDAHVGALAALAPKGWFISFAQPTNDPPARLTPDQIYGICRTVRALSENAPVYVSHGDFAGLPAIAAGAFGVGTGWDKRQRVLSFPDYGPRDPASQGRWNKRPAFAGLLGTLSERDGQTLGAQNPALAARLGGLPNPPQVPQIFEKHVEQLSQAVGQVLAAGAAYEPRFRALDAMYDAARANWSAVSAATGMTDASRLWIDPFQAGLRMYARSEGWRT